MARTRFVTYADLKAPVAFHDAAELEVLARQVIMSWPEERDAEDADLAPFARLRPASSGQWRVEFAAEAGCARTWDSVDAVCDLISEMAWQRLRAQPDLLCLHAAAVAFGDRLVVFPNARRAGKSTLTIALARQGLTLFTDDFLPVEIDAGDRRLMGIANGIAPRLRLPLPDRFSDTFKAWVAWDSGPGNKRYKYLTDVPLATGQSRLPIGAVVVLDRQERPTQPRLETAQPSDVLQVMIEQNFSRDQHAGRILSSVEAVTRTAPLFRLVYSDAEAAANWLATCDELQTLPEARIAETPAEALQHAYERDAAPGEPFAPDALYQHASDLVEIEVDGGYFLADGKGQAIHRLNQGSLAIWRILAEPASLDDVAEIMSLAFPDADPEQIRIDAARCLRHFAGTRLIVKASPAIEPAGVDL